MHTGIDLIVGLGNPGPEYEATRHNVGFWFVDALAHSARASFKPEAKFFGAACKLSLPLGGAENKECWLLKPVTFMNRSGQAVASLAAFYKIPVNKVLVVHDDLDLPAGSVRLKQGGGHGGHNGLRDIIAHLGDNFLRLRIGIGHPGKGNDVTAYVLNRPSREDSVLISEALDEGQAVLPLLLSGDYGRVMQRLHSRV